MDGLEKCAILLTDMFTLLPNSGRNHTQVFQLERYVLMEPGKLANFTELNDKRLTCDPLKLKHIGVWGTVLEGRIKAVDYTA
jgi:hypothetical protein